MKQKKTKHGVDISSTLGMRTVINSRSWVLVANRGGAQLLEYDDGNFRLIKDFPFPDGKTKESLLVSDRPGRSFDSWSQAKGGHQTGNPRHGMGSHESPSDHLMDVLSERVTDFIENGRQDNKLTELILVAEPRLLGRIKSRLSEKSISLITHIIEKDFAWLSAAAIEQKLRDLLPQRTKRALA